MHSTVQFSLCLSQAPSTTASSLHTSGSQDPQPGGGSASAAASEAAEASGSESGSEAEREQLGMMNILRSFAPPSEKAAPKAKAKANTAPKQVRAKPATTGGDPKRVRVAPADAPPSSNAKPKDPKNQSQSKRKSEAAGLDDLDNVPDPANGLLDGDMSDADKAVVQGYIEKLDTLKDLRPPLADNAFKANLAEVITSLNHIKADLKVKKRSAGRRSKKENDPLFLALEGVEDQVARLTQLVRCNLSGHADV